MDYSDVVYAQRGLRTKHSHAASPSAAGANNLKGVQLTDLQLAQQMPH